MKFASIVIALPLLFLGQTGGDLDVFTLDGRPCPLQGDAKSPDVKDLNRLKDRYHQGLRTTFPGPTHHNGGSGIDGDSCFLVKPKLLD